MASIALVRPPTTSPPSPPPLGPHPYLSSPVKGRIDPLRGGDGGDTTEQRRPVDEPSFLLPRPTTPAGPSADMKTYFKEKEKSQHSRLQEHLRQRDVLSAGLQKDNHVASLDWQARKIEAAKNEAKEKEAKEAMLASPLGLATRPQSAVTPRTSGVAAKLDEAVAAKPNSIASSIAAARLDVQKLQNHAARESAEHARELEAGMQAAARDRASKSALLAQQAANLARRSETSNAQQRSAGQRAATLAAEQRRAHEAAVAKAAALKQRLKMQREKLLLARERAYDTSANWPLAPTAPPVPTTTSMRPQTAASPSSRSPYSPRGWNETRVGDATHDRRSLRRTAEALSPTRPSPAAYSGYREAAFSSPRLLKSSPRLLTPEASPNGVMQRWRL